MKRTIITCFAALLPLLFCNISYGQPDSRKPLPVNPALISGTLPNGFTYYIQHNGEPKGRADFYIIYSVGALQEEENQNGLAHFLEHMAFNGSANFPGGNASQTSIVKTLERHGVQFGRNINAYTAQDRTVYYLNDVVSSDPALIDTCLLVLHDWAHYLTLSDEEIDNERGVISEEWRTRNSAYARMSKKWMPVVTGNTKWASHDVIGDLDIIKNFKPEELRDFYKTWYHPLNQAVAVVGDFDPADMEARVKSVFSDIPAAEHPLPKQQVLIPGNEEPQYVLATDSEQTRNSIMMVMLRESKVDNTVGGLRDELIHSIYNSLIRERIMEKVSAGRDTTILGGSVSYSHFVTGYDALMISSNSREGEECSSLAGVYSEAVRARKFGFTASEFDRAVKDLIASADRVYNQRDKVTNSQICDELVQMFAYGNVSMSPEDYRDIATEVLNSLKLSDLNDFAAANPDWKNCTLVVMAPTGQSKYPGKDELLAALAAVDADETLEQYSEQSFSGSIAAGEIPGGKIVKEKKLPLFDAVQWTLSNGAKVIYSFADLEKDQILAIGTSLGGVSHYPAEKLKDAYMVLQLPSICGLGKYNSSELEKALAGKMAATTIKLEDEREMVIGSCGIKDFDTMMEMFMLRFTEPRFDSLQFYSGMKRMAPIIDAMGADPNYKMIDTLSFITQNYSPRVVNYVGQDFLDADLDEIEAVYRDRFSDASDFTYFVVGDIEEHKAREAVEKYIGSIPSAYRKESYVNHRLYPASGRTELVVPIAFQTPKTNINVQYHALVKLVPRNRLMMSVLKRALDTRFNENIREKEGGTYGVHSKLTTTHLPEDRIVYEINFDTDPDKAGHLKELLYAEIDRVCKEDISAEELDSVVKTMLKNREQSKNENAFVRKSLQDYILYGERSDIPRNYEDILKSMKPSQLRKFASRFFSKADQLDVTFVTKPAE